MTTNVRWFLGLVLLTALSTLTLIAQTNTTALPGATDAVPAVELGKLLIAVIVPLIVAGARAVAPKIPKAMLPPLAIALGALADYVGSLLGAWQGNIVVGLALGAAGIGVREASVQLKSLAAPPTP